MPGRPVRKARTDLIKKELVRQYGLVGAARVNGLLPDSRNPQYALMNAGKRSAPGDEEDPAAKQIHKYNLNIDLLSFGREFAQETEKQFRQDVNQVNYIYGILEQLNAADAASFRQGQISIVDLLFNPQSPYKIF